MLHGNPSKRPLNPFEPRPEKKAPRCPAWLSPLAKRVWRRIVPELQRLGVLTTVDGDALAAYCQTFARWQQAEEFLQKHGEVYPLKDDSGRVKCMMQFPQVSIARNLLSLLKSYQQEFGLTPSARTRIEVRDPESEVDDFRARDRAHKLGL